jgi:hypothetical protein
MKMGSIETRFLTLVYKSSFIEPVGVAASHCSSFQEVVGSNLDCVILNGDFRGLPKLFDKMPLGYVGKATSAAIQFTIHQSSCYRPYII